MTLSDVDPVSGIGGLRVTEGARRGRIGDVSDDRTIYRGADRSSNVGLPLVPVSKLEEMVVDGPVPGAPNDGLSPD